MENGVGGVFDTEQRHGERSMDAGFAVGHDEDPFENLRLGRDIRFVLAGVGGGGIRISAEVARRQLPYLETVAINCDPRVQDLEEFDRRICLGPESGVEPDTGGSAVVGGHLARAAEPALERTLRRGDLRHDHREPRRGHRHRGPPVRARGGGPRLLRPQGLRR